MEKYRVPALEKALILIEVLADSGEPLRITELSSLCEIPKTTVLMTLTTFEKWGYVKKSEGGKYSITTKFLDLGASKSSLKEISRMHLEDLANELKFTVHLSVLRGNENVLLDKVSGPGFIQFSTYAGQCQSFHTTSSGKAILAYLTTEKVLEILPAKELPVYTSNTITSIPRLLNELDTIRSVGYSVEDEEEELGVRCIGAPIFNASGKVIGAVSITAILSELDLSSVSIYADKVKQVANSISGRLSGKGKNPKFLKLPLKNDVGGTL